MLHAAFQREAEGYVTIDSYRRIFWLSKDEDLLKLRFREFEKLGLVIRTGTSILQVPGATGNLYRLSTEGIHFVLQKTMEIAEQERGLTEDLPAEIVETLDKIWTWFASATAQPLDQAWKLAPNDIFENVSASDRVVRLDHNSGEYENATEALETVIREFRDDHHLDNVLGREKRLY